MAVHVRQRSQVIGSVRSGHPAGRPPPRVKRWLYGLVTGTLKLVMDPTALLAAYDEQLRADAETPCAISVTRVGPLRLANFAGGRGFVTYRDLGGADVTAIRQLVPAVLAHYCSDPDINRIEWKTRGHDLAPGLEATLRHNGFAPDPPESIMIGDAQSLAVGLPLPTGVSVRQVTEEPDVRAMAVMQDEAFGEPVRDENVDALLRRQSVDKLMELWVAEVGGRIVSAGRLEPVPGTRFAGIWGGATRTEWRGRGIYRALTASRARSALRAGKTLINCDSTEFSRPILERSGLVKVSTTTPYHWRR